MWFSTSLSQNQKLPEATPAPDDAANLTGMVTEIDLGDVSEEDEAEEIEAEDEEIKKQMEAEKAKKTKVRSTIHNQNLLMLAIMLEQVSLGIDEYLVSHLPGIIYSLYDFKLAVTSVQWATPFKIHTPPMEEFGKVHHRGSVNFQIHLPSV